MAELLSSGGPSGVEVREGETHTAWFAHESFGIDGGVSTIARVIVRPQVDIQKSGFLDLGVDSLRALGYTTTSTLLELRVDAKTGSVPGGRAELIDNSVARVDDAVAKLILHLDGISADDPATYLTTGEGKAF